MLVMLLKQQVVSWQYLGSDSTRWCGDWHKLYKDSKSYSFNSYVTSLECAFVVIRNKCLIKPYQEFLYWYTWKAMGMKKDVDFSFMCSPLVPSVGKVISQTLITSTITSRAPLLPICVYRSLILGKRKTEECLLRTLLVTPRWFITAVVLPVIPGNPITFFPLEQHFRRTCIQYLKTRQLVYLHLPTITIFYHLY